MTSYRKKLIEVALPLKAINEASAREKSIRHGHPSTLHLWWARRPLAACRAVLFASLVDDPDSDPMYAGNEGLAGQKRAELFNLIDELVQWDNSNNPRVINRARAEIARSVAAGKVADGVWTKETVVMPGATAHDFKHMLAKPEAVDAFLAEHAPPVLDPFCGGGSIPLEAQRLGLRAYASDLNPVPVLITKALVEIPPKFAGRPPLNPDWQKKSAEEKAARLWTGAQGLAEDVRYYGRWMRDEAEKRIGQLYPKVKITQEMARDRRDLEEHVGQELTVIAWLWARTVTSPNPAFQGIHVPLVSGFWLSKKIGKMAWIEPLVDRNEKRYRFEVRTGTPTAAERKSIDKGTKLGRGCKFRCLLSDEPISEHHIKDAGKRGLLGTALLAIVADGTRGRVYIQCSGSHVVKVEPPTELRGVDAPLANDPRNLWCLGYGLDTFDKLFTPRQLVALTTFSDLVQESRERVIVDARHCELLPDDRRLEENGTGIIAYSDAVATYLGLAVSRSTNTHCTLAIWSNSRDQSINAFGRQAIPMTWDFPEVNPFAEAAGDLLQTVASMTQVLDRVPAAATASVMQLDATAALQHCGTPVIATDPPYYDNIGYADLSDFFYVWLRRSLGSCYSRLFATLQTPKLQELIASPYRHPGGKVEAQRFFETGLGYAFARIRASHDAAFPLTIFYGFKQAETDEDNSEVTVASTGWETMLEGIKDAGFSIAGTWPMRTERDQGLKTGTNVLASSIVLVCRPRTSEAGLATRKEFMTALRVELPYALKNLQHGNIAPVDLAQAAIGPGMGVFTRYANVIESNGEPMTIRTALGIINQVLDEVLAEQEGEFDSDTRWALAWFEQFGMNDGPFGVAETLSKAKNTAVSGLVEAGIVHARAGKVRLVRRDELDTAWNPTNDPRLTVWEVTQHLIRTVEVEGESAAAALMHKLGGIGEISRDLAYRLYNICERNKWTEDALAFNGLVVSWPDLAKLARSTGKTEERQRDIGFE